MKVYVVEWYESPSDHGIHGIYATFRAAVRATGARRTWHPRGGKTDFWRTQFCDYFIVPSDVE